MMKQEKYKRAHALFELALKNDPDFSRALYEMAQVSIDEGNLEDAKNETNRSTQEPARHGGFGRQSVRKRNQVFGESLQEVGASRSGLV